MNNKLKKLVLIFSILFSLCITSSSQSCRTNNFPGNKVFNSCNDLPSLNSIHWNYNQTSEALDIAYRQTNVRKNRWVAWALNPTDVGMVGSQALVALQQSDGTIRAYTSSIDDYQTRLQEGDLSFPVSNLTATYEKNEMTIYATLKMDSRSLVLNQVWQDGPVSGNTPRMHRMGGVHANSIDFFSGQTQTQTVPTVSGSAPSPRGGGLSPTGAPSPITKKPLKNSIAERDHKQNIHGLLNVVSWGILFPIGVVSARYMKVFPSANPTWFYIHVICQTSAFIMGAAGYTTGIQLTSASPKICHTSHGILGTVLIVVATIQFALAVFARPNKEHKLRFYWNLVHHLFGYLIIILSIVNISKGFVLYEPKWKNTYVAIIISLAVVAAVLEAYTWFLVLRRKKTSKGDDGTNGHNEYEEKAKDIA